MKNRILFLYSLMIYMLLGCSDTTKPNNINTQPQSYNAPFSSNFPVAQISITPILPRVVEKTIGKYSTRILDSSSSRLNNLKLACENIDKTVIQPGEIFSYNDDVGPVSPSNGFKKATMLDGHGKKIKGYGGGLCQISSTIYNAIKKTNLQVIERHEHSKAVGYVKKGNDAAIYKAGGKDFRFKNTLSTPIKIYANVRNRKVNINVKAIIKK